MAYLTLNIPDQLHNRLSSSAESQGVPLDNYILSFLLELSGLERMDADEGERNHSGHLLDRLTSIHQFLQENGHRPRSEEEIIAQVRDVRDGWRD